jgi:hypothetical protein
MHIQILIRFHEEKKVDANIVTSKPKKVVMQKGRADAIPPNDTGYAMSRAK